MKWLLLFVILEMCGFSTFATAQFPDKIIFEGREFSLISNPMEKYFEKNPDKKPKGGIVSSALWRGYVATFEVRDDQLYVKDIEIMYSATPADQVPDLQWKSVMKEVFGNQTNIKVDWLTGLLVLPYGKLLSYVHMGYGSTFENYHVLELKEGNFVQSRQFNSKSYEKFKDRQFAKYKETEDYKKTKDRLIKDGRTEDEIDVFLRSFVTDYTSVILDD